MTEVAYGTLIIVALVLVLASFLLVLRKRLIPAEALDIDVNGKLRLRAQRGAKLLEALHGGGPDSRFGNSSAGRT